MAKRGAVGVSDHAGWSVLVTVSGDGTLVDRRRVELIDGGLPCLPHHHEAQGLPEEQAVALVERVRESARRRARESLEVLERAVSVKVASIAIRACPELPPTVIERIRDYRAQCVADTVMYRQAVAEAAAGRGWAVSWYDRRRVLADAARALKVASVEDLLVATGKAAGSPWTQDHRFAMAAAIAHRKD